MMKSFHLSNRRWVQLLGSRHCFKVAHRYFLVLVWFLSIGVDLRHFTIHSTLRYPTSSTSYVRAFTTPSPISTHHQQQYKSNVPHYQQHHHTKRWNKDRNRIHSSDRHTSTSYSYRPTTLVTLGASSLRSISKDSTSHSNNDKDFPNRQRQTLTPYQVMYPLYMKPLDDGKNSNSSGYMSSSSIPIDNERSDFDEEQATGTFDSQISHDEDCLHDKNDMKVYVTHTLVQSSRIYKHFCSNSGTIITSLGSYYTNTARGYGYGNTLLSIHGL